MKWLLIYVLLNGEIAEYPTTEADCQRALQMAAATGYVKLTFFSGKQVVIPAWNVACVEFAGGAQKEVSAR